MNIDRIVGIIRQILENKPRMSSLYIEETLTAIHNSLTEEEKRINESLKPRNNPDIITRSDWSAQDDKLIGKGK